jgi:2-C-methyl-D-erythritol 2,4-cyclodiphosphate synthase
MAGVNEPQIRVGQGFDVHRLANGRSLVLGGVSIPFAKGLVGHSDGDALLHAVADAILGAVAAGDIGAAFPSSDDENRGISGETILRKAVAMAMERGFRPAQIDTTVVCEAPRLAPHQDEMRANLARILGLAASEVSVKVKSADGLGVVGAGDAIAAFAVAVVTR